MTTKSQKIFPFVWPWRGENNQRLSIQQLVKAKAFSISYLVIIWTVVGVLGFASTWNCDGTWQLALQCEYAFWVKNLAEGPFLLTFRNFFTTSILHNGIDHILFVTVVGFLLLGQSHEAAFGSKKTALIFFSSYLTVAPFWAGFYTIGVDIFPESEFMHYAFKRNWMGGSIGMFQMYGSLATQSRKPLIMLGIPFLFEAINLMLGIVPHISLMHLTSVVFGFTISKIIFNGKG